MFGSFGRCPAGDETWLDIRRYFPTAQVSKFAIPAMHADLTARFTRTIRSIATGEIPEDVTAIAKLCVLDWLGVTIAGADQPLVSMLCEEVHTSEVGACTLIR